MDRITVLCNRFTFLIWFLVNREAQGDSRDESIVVFCNPGDAWKSNTSQESSPTT